MSTRDFKTKVVPLNDYSAFENGLSNERSDRPELHRNNSQNDESDDKDQSWKAMMLAFTQTAGITGVRFIGDRNAPGFRRFLWLIIVLLALSGLLYQASRLIMSYMDRPVNVNIQYMEKAEKPDFPAITICNNNLFRYHSLVSYFGGTIMAGFFIPYLWVIFPVEGESYSDDYLEIPEESNNYAGDTLLGFMNGSAHPSDEMIKSCSFSGIPCGPENFTQTVTNYGICYTFNSDTMGEVAEVRNAGQRYGLQLQLFANEREYIGPRNVVGFRLMVHGQDEIPDVAGQGVSISPGMDTTIGLTKTLISNLGSPYGNCVVDVDNNLKYFDGKYSLSKCLTECETDYAIEKCGCKYYYMPGNETFCSPNELRYCFFDAMDNFATESGVCSNCKQPCEQIKYNVKLSYGAYPSAIYATNLYSRKRWPCDDAIGYYLANRSPLIDNTYMDELIFPPLVEKMFSIEYNGKNITEFIPSLEFHTAMIYPLYLHVFRETATEITYLFMNYLHHDTDDTGSDYYNKTYTKMLTTKMNFHVGPWDELNSTLKEYFSPANLTSDVEEYLIDNLFNGYYLPLFDEMFPFLYETIRDVRENLAAELFKNEDIPSICKTYMKDNVAKVNIYFEDMKLESIIQQPGYKSFNLICDIGGSLGLFFGASLVTFLEIFDFFIVKIWMMKMASKKRNM